MYVLTEFRRPDMDPDAVIIPRRPRDLLELGHEFRHRRPTRGPTELEEREEHGRYITMMDDKFRRGDFAPRVIHERKATEAADHEFGASPAPPPKPPTRPTL